MPTVPRSLLGSAAIVAAIPFFLEDPKKYWWLSLIIGTGIILVVDDLVYYLSDGKYCLLCKMIPPPGYKSE